MNVSERDRRICEVAISILDGAPSRRLNVVVLNKALFYADLKALRDYGDTLTGSTYLALPNGPTIKGYDKHLVKPLELLGWAEQIQEGVAKPLRKIATPDEFRFMSDEQRRLAREMGEKLGHFTSAKASQLSHKNAGWKVARSYGEEQNGRGIQINLVLAMQQLDAHDDDDWLSAAFTADELNSIESKKDEPIPFA
jgi:hypothetical protein